MAVVILFVVLGITSGAPAQAAALLQGEPTADACAPPAMQVRNSAVNVREGPDPNYAIILVLRTGEGLPLVGRHHGFRWWAVELPDGGTGWVWDSGVTVTGNIGSVPLLPAPPLNGVVPDTTEEWIPVVEEPCLEVAEPSPGEPVTSTVPLVATPTPQATDASATELERWTEPQNLSQSGGARNPLLIIDAAQTMHVIWEDAFNGFTYTHRDGETWTAPVTITVPFSETIPHLFADADGQIQALWIDEEGLLQQSRATAAMITEPDAWQAPVQLAAGITVIDSTVDGAGQIHLAYLRSEGTAEQPAGIYYQRSVDGGMSWTEARLLDVSPYFRGIDADESNVQIVAESNEGTTHVYVTWDNRPRKRIFLMHSANGGESWDPAQELVSPDSTSSIILPFGARISAEGGNVVVVWQYGQPGAQCQRYAQHSTDHGDSWSESLRLVDLNPGFATCPNENQLYADDGLFYLLTVLGNELFIQAWDGELWSTPQRQAELSGFNDPDTLNTVSLGCHQAALFDGRSMAMLACGAGSAFADVWFATRSLGTVETWFPPPSAWSDAAAIDAGAAAYGSLNVLSDGEGGVHALWSARPSEQDAGWEIYYSGLAGERWLPPATLFGGTVSGDGLLAAAVSADDRLYVIWRDSEGALLFSRADAAEAAIASDWAPATSLPVPLFRAGGLALATARSGALYAAYTVPVNEGRGIFILRSDDRGDSWSEPSLVFDGELSGWEIVGAPQLAVTGNGTLHFLFTEEKLGLTADVSAETLYYARCSARATVDTCSEPAVVGLNQPVWSAVVATGTQTVYALWQEDDGSSVRLRHQVSVDDGASWSEPTLVNTLASGNSVPAMVTADHAARLHLMQADGEMVGSWLWDGSWSQEEPVAAVVGGPLQGAVSSNGVVAVLFAREGQAESEAEDVLPLELAGVSRQIELGEVAAQPAPSPEATQVTPTSTPPASPTPTVAFVPTPASTNGSGAVSSAPSADNPAAGIGLGLIPAALLIVAVLAYGARSVWVRRR